MQNISVYDIEAEKLERIAEDNFSTIPEIIEALVTAIEDGDINIADYI